MHASHVQPPIIETRAIGQSITRQHPGHVQALLFLLLLFYIVSNYVVVTRSLFFSMFCKLYTCVLRALLVVAAVIYVL